MFTYCGKTDNSKSTISRTTANVILGYENYNQKIERFDLTTVDICICQGKDKYGSIKRHLIQGRKFSGFFWTLSKG